MCNSTKAEDELVIKYIGKVEVTSLKGKEQMDVFYMTNKTTDWKVFELYWFAKTNSHQALASWFTNSVVDWGDSLSCFHSWNPELVIFPGFTNVADPFSEKEMRKFCEPIFKAMRAFEGFPGIQRLTPESVLGMYALGSPAKRTYGFHIIITKTSVTSTNVTLELQGVQAEFNNQTYPTNNVGKFTFGKDLNLIAAEVITNAAPRK